MVATRRVRLTWAEKHTIVKECQRRRILGTTKELRAISQWAKERFNLKTPLANAHWYSIHFTSLYSTQPLGII